MADQEDSKVHPACTQMDIRKLCPKCKRVKMNPGATLCVLCFVECTTK